VLEEKAGGRLRFVHDKIREVAYERLAPSRRRELHRSAAELIEARMPAQEQPPHAQLAHHWQRAGEPDRARHHALAGARAAGARYAQDEAERLYRAYLSVVERPTRESIEARNELGHQILRDRGRLREAIVEQEIAVREARDIADRAAEGRSLHRLGMLHGDVGEVEASRRLLEQALGVLDEIADRQGRAHALRSLGFLDYQQGRIAEASAAIEEALAVYRELGDREHEAIGLGNLALLHVERGRFDEARVLNERLIGLYSESGNRRAEGIARYNLARIHIELGRLETAWTLMEEARGIYRQIGNRQLEAMPLLGLAAVAREQGRPEAAAALYDEALAIFGELGDRRIEAITRLARAGLERQVLSLGEAQRLLDLAEPALREVGDRPSLVVCLSERGHLCLAAGRSGRAYLDEAQTLARQVPIRPETEQGRALEMLRRAVEAYERQQPLLRGNHPEDVPAALRRRLEAEAPQPAGPRLVQREAG
jgi:tetratricopeptide (TPR) repeat protein